MPKFELIQAFMVSSLPDPSEMKAQDFRHYKSMGIFSNAQGQLLNSAVLGRIGPKF